MERVKEEDGSPMESANNSENVIEMEKSVMENSTSGDKFVKVDKMGEKHRRNRTLKQLKMIAQKKKQGVQRKTETLKKKETHAATGHDNHPGTYLFKNPSG